MKITFEEEIKNIPTCCSKPMEFKWFISGGSGSYSTYMFQCKKCGTIKDYSGD